MSARPPTLAPAVLLAAIAVAGPVAAAAPLAATPSPSGPAVTAATATTVTTAAPTVADAAPNPADAAPPPAAVHASTVGATHASIDTSVAAIPAPLCGVPADAGVLALVPPGGASDDERADGSDDTDGATTDTPAADGTPTPDPAVGTTRTAVVDRFEGDTAVLLVEARGDVVARRLVRREALPRAARHQDAVVTVTVVADAVAAITYQPVETVRRSREARRRFERLSQPTHGSGGPAVC